MNNMNYSEKRNSTYFIPINCADDKRVYSDGGKDYQLRMRYLRLLHRYGLNLITYSNGTFKVVNFDEQLTDYIQLKQVGYIVKRLKRYKAHHNLKQLTENIYFLIDEALSKKR